MKKKGDNPPSRFANERGSSVPVKKRIGQREREKKDEPGGKGDACTDSRKKGTPNLRLQARGGPCASVRKVERSAGTREKKNLGNSRCWVREK